MKDPVANHTHTMGKRFMTTVLATAVFNTVIAVLLTTVGFGRSFAITLVFSQCIGLTICLFVTAGIRLSENAAPKVQTLVVMATLSLGAASGTALGAMVIRRMTGADPWPFDFLLRVIGISVLFGLIITYFFHSRQELATSGRLLDEERYRRLESEKQLLQADLKRLQAQVEPHFLFNTLSNIVSLMDTDLGTAKRMLGNLIQYLRTALSRTRNRETTLTEEVNLLTAYLDIFAIRMGARLQYEIDIPADLGAHPFAPLLLQPLVENAVIHGLEPKIHGGHIHITARPHGGWLRIEVADDGMGIKAETPRGVGLANVRERLETLFTPPGRLSIEAVTPTGVRAVLEVPLASGWCRQPQGMVMERGETR